MQPSLTPQAELSAAPWDCVCLCTYLSIQKTFVQFVYIPNTMQGFEDVVQSKEAMRVTGLFCNFFFNIHILYRFTRFLFWLENKRYIKYKGFSRKYQTKRDD